MYGDDERRTCVATNPSAHAQLLIGATIVTLIKATKLHNVQLYSFFFCFFFLSPFRLSFRLFTVRFLGYFFLILFVYVNDNHKGRSHLYLTFSTFIHVSTWSVQDTKWNAKADLWAVRIRLATDFMRKRIIVSAGMKNMSPYKSNEFNQLYGSE